MKEQVFRVLVVDDCEPWRRFVTSTLQEQLDVLIVGEASDGLTAVQKAQEQHPDLIVLDIGLPSINGIEAARRIRKLTPSSKILFASENRSPDIAEEALSTGARGYMVKSDAANDLVPAVMSILQGKRFLSRKFAGYELAEVPQTPIVNMGV